MSNPLPASTAIRSTLQGAQSAIRRAGPKACLLTPAQHSFLLDEIDKLYAIADATQKREREKANGRS